MNTRRPRLYWFGIGLLLCILPAIGLAAPGPLPVPAPTAPPAATAPIDPLSVTVVSDATNRVGQVAYVTVTLRNTSGADLLLKNLTVAISDRAAELFLKPLPCGLQQRGEISLAKGASFEQSCRFEMKPVAYGASLESLRNALLSADVRLTVEADVGGGKKYSYFPVATIKASEFSIFVGGVCGALMLAFFVWVEKILKTPAVREAWVLSFFVTMLMGFRGGLMAIMALLLSKTTQAPGSPVSLTVLDFSGGLLVGLFSYPLATWISSALKLDGAFVPAEAKR